MDEEEHFCKNSKKFIASIREATLSGNEYLVSCDPEAFNTLKKCTNLIYKKPQQDKNLKKELN